MSFKEFTWNSRSEISWHILEDLLPCLMTVSWKSHQWVELLHFNNLYHSFVNTRCLITAQVLIRFQAHACGIRKGGGWNLRWAGFPSSLSFLWKILLPSFHFIELRLWEASISCLTVWVFKSWRLKNLAFSDLLYNEVRVSCIWTIQGTGCKSVNSFSK